MEMAVQLKICIDHTSSCYGVTSPKAAADWTILKHPKLFLRDPATYLFN